MRNQKHTRIIVVLTGMMIVGMFLIGGKAAYAQGSWCHSWDFVPTGDGWSLGATGQHDGEGWTSNTSGADGVYIISPQTYFQSTFSSVQVNFDGSWSGINPYVYVYDYSQATLWGSTNNTGNPINVSLSSAIGNFVQVIADRRVGDAQYFQGLHIVGITICGSGLEDPWLPPNTPTPTPTGTLTPTPTATPAAPIVIRPTCLLFPSGAQFTPAVWSVSGGATIQSDGLHLPPGGVARYAGNLDTTQKYNIKVIYDSNPAPSQEFTWNIAGSNVTGRTTPDGAQHTIELNDLSFFEGEPYVIGGGYRFSWKFTDVSFESGAEQPDAGLVINYWCISEIESSEEVRDTKSEECFECIYEPKDVVGVAGLPHIQHIVENILNTIGWLWCSLRKFLECQLWIILGQIVKAILDILNWIIGFAEWIVGTVGEIIQFVLNVVARFAEWLWGHFRNIIQGVGNFLIGILEWLVNTASSVVNFFRTIFETLGLVIGAVLQVIGAIINAVLSFFATVLQWIAEIFGLGDVMITSLESGFNTGAPAPLGYSPPLTISQSFSCMNPDGVLYPVCLAFYVLDNTVFQGPGYYIFIVIISIISIDTIVWATNLIRTGILNSEM